MPRSRSWRSPLASGRSLRAVAALVLAGVLSLAQGVEHTHAAGPDSLQCAVCHWGQIHAATPTPTPAAPPPPSFHPEGVRAADRPPAAPDTRLPPVRGPPSLR
ncbi:MAG: hypothetical protein RQ751_07945 [Longimicrobiales bacterium]|nr:hypothetical protein [Longimicrobiales bacterium]